MKIFIVGLPKSGRTTFSKELADELGFVYVDVTSWVKSTYRDKDEKESDSIYQDSYHEYVADRLKKDPLLFYRNVIDVISFYPERNFIIDGCLSPKDFSALFDYNKDVIIFLNRTDNDSDYKDHENIGVSVIRDYCYWMSSANLVSKKQWIEYNFKIPGDDNDFIRSLGSKNSVFIVRSLKKAISHMIELLR